MNQNQPDLPDLWLLSDVRNDAQLETALSALPAGSGFVYRHYHLGPDARRARFDSVAAVARAHDHIVILSDGPATAHEWGADGVYGAPKAIGLGINRLRFATAHNAAEVTAANKLRADAVFISPVFPTRSHDGAAVLGEAGFRTLAALADMPVIALGGMDAVRAKALDLPRWAAIDGLSADAVNCRDPKDS